MKDRGFTLIELAIVIVIIGILVAVAVPRYANLTQEAKTAQLQASYGAIKSGIAIAIAKKGGAPPTSAELDSNSYTVNTSTFVIYDSSAGDILTTTAPSSATRIGSTLTCSTGIETKFYLLDRQTSTQYYAELCYNPSTGSLRPGL